MSYFSNSTINNLNVHYMLRATAFEMSNVFTLSYLYKQGLQLWQVFAVYVMILVFRLLTRPTSLKACHKIGLRAVLFIGTGFMCLRYLCLIPADSFGFWTFLYAFVTATSESFYWLSYHAYIAQIGSAEDRGHHLGVREAFATLSAVLGPLLGGVLLTYGGGALAFGGATAITVLSFLPLSRTEKDRPIPIPALSKEEKRNVPKYGMKTFFGDGFFVIATNSWPLVVFMLLGENYGSFGMIFALAAAFRMASNMILGKLIDHGRGGKIYLIALCMHAAVAAARGFWAYSIPQIILCDFFSAIALSFSVPSMMTAIYNSSKKSPSPLYFTYYTEVGWDFGAVICALSCMGITYFGYNLRFGMLLLVLGASISAYHVGKYYRKHPAAKTKPIPASDAEPAL